MPKRRCGTIAIDVKWNDLDNQYRVVLKHDKDRALALVGAPVALPRAVDHPQSYDEAAQAALSFALDDGHSWIESAAWHDENGGWMISRDRPQIVRW